MESVRNYSQDLMSRSGLSTRSATVKYWIWKDILMLYALRVITFAKVAQRVSFSRAAESLGLTQAAVSQQVQHIERELGPLLLRKGRQFGIDAAGLALEAYAKEMSDAEQRLRQTLTRDDATRGAVKLVSPGSLGLAVYPMLLDLQGMHPGLSIQHRFAPTQMCSRAYWLRVMHWVCRLTSLVTLGCRAERSLIEASLELVVPSHAEAYDWSHLMALGLSTTQMARTW